MRKTTTAQFRVIFTELVRLQARQILMDKDVNLRRSFVTSVCFI